MVDNQPTIVIIDDDLINLDLLCCELSDYYNLYPVSDGLSALAIFAKVLPDLIILDIMTPQIDSISLYLAQQQQINQVIPVIFVAANDTIESKRQLINLRINDYITKPYHLNEIRAKIHNYLRNPIENNFVAQQLTLLKSLN